ncbi:hypothetical protein M2444_004770 [Paenibacillus sp. PastF-3]|uniref:putative metallopeptidase n=1 Tax=Paenibacillus sp. PastF-3 TaxID=2940626 RepID=UPI001D7C4939|nr:putative metallopeptidase [Paenibacillus sp. PastF-3]MBY3621096.1 hypothetical protein [Acinetobacter sp. CUI P1]MDH6372941.1 hypothetical protein [Paenibacillus sp. PastF-3]
MSGSYEQADEVIMIIQRILKSENEFKDLKNCNIIARFRTGNWNSKGRQVLGRAKVLTALERYETKAEAVIIINKNAWQFLDDRMKEALVTHELCHYLVPTDKHGSPKLNKNDKRPVLQICGHDIEEFQLVVKKYGLWMTDTREFFDAARQGEQLSMETSKENNVVYLHMVN